jgi:hypothetical protein
MRKDVIMVNDDDVRNFAPGMVLRVGDDEVRVRAVCDVFGPVLVVDAPWWWRAWRWVARRVRRKVKP